MLSNYNATARLPCGGEGALFYPTHGKVEYFEWFPTVMALSTFFFSRFRFPLNYFEYP